MKEKKEITIGIFGGVNEIGDKYFMKLLMNGAAADKNIRLTIFQKAYKPNENGSKVTIIKEREKKSDDYVRLRNKLRTDYKELAECKVDVMVMPCFTAQLLRDEILFSQNHNVPLIDGIDAIVQYAINNGLKDVNIISSDVSMEKIRGEFKLKNITIDKNSKNTIVANLAGLQKYKSDNKNDNKNFINAYKILAETTIKTALRSKVASGNLAEEKIHIT